jgi:2-methylcitrate dehydratase
VDEIAVADAHPLGAKPFKRADYIRKFQTLTEDLISPEESDRFIDAAQQLAELSAEELKGLNVVLPPGRLNCAGRDGRGIF